MRELRKSRWNMFELETVGAGSFVLRDVRGNSFELTLDKLSELSEMLEDAEQNERAAFDEFLDAEYEDYSKTAREWRNFATTGDPDVSPEQYYSADRL